MRASLINGCAYCIDMHFKDERAAGERLKAARLDAIYDQERRKLIGVDLLLINDFARQPLDMLETADFYELCVERHHSKSTVQTSNRDASEWLAALPTRRSLSPPATGSRVRRRNWSSKVSPTAITGN
jgi:DNA replication protein DnaC